MVYRFVLIDPNPEDLHWFTLTLAEAQVKYEATTFPSSVAALSVLRESRAHYDAVVVNYQLPFLEVADAVARLRELSALQGALFAVTVSLPEERRAVPPGVRLLMKPVDVEQLHSLLRLTPLSRTDVRATDALEDCER